MKYLACFLLLIIGSSCKKDSQNRVDIYLLKSFITTADQTAVPQTISISNAILDDKPLVQNDDIIFYEKANYRFKLKKNLKPLIQNFSKDKGFAVMVNNKPVYYGVFHPAFLSSITFGLATIDPFFTTENSVIIQYANFNGNPHLALLDKRNDPRLLTAMAASGRLR